MALLYGYVTVTVQALGPELVPHGVMITFASIHARGLEPADKGKISDFVRESTTALFT